MLEQCFTYWTLLMYKVEYIDWKGRETCTYLCADSAQEAREIAMVMQGVYVIKTVKEWKH